MKQQEEKLFVSQRVSVRNLSMHYRVSTNQTPLYDETIIMVHGLVVSGRYMLPTAKLLAPYYRVYIPDLPGSGKSEKSDSILSIAELADILAEWMQAIGLQQATLVGNSVGCQIIVQFALRQPAHIQRAILTAPTMDPQARTVPWQVLRWLANAPYEPLSLYFIILRDYLKIGFHRFSRTLRYSLKDPIERHLPSITIPTLVVRGTRDMVVPQHWAEKVAQLLPQGRLVTLKGASHDMNYSSAEPLAQAIRTFVTPQPSYHLEMPEAQH